MFSVVNSCAEKEPLSPPRTANHPYLELLRADEQARQQGQSLLTDAGVAFVRRGTVTVRAATAADPSGDSPVGSGADPQDLPRWDGATRRLWLGQKLLKEFRQPAPNQTLILAAFQDGDWRENHIDDPLPRQPGEREADAKARLQQTIKNLNRLLPEGSIRFRGDGTGQGVFWEHQRAAKPSA